MKLGSRLGRAQIALVVLISACLVPMVLIAPAAAIPVEFVATDVATDITDARVVEMGDMDGDGDLDLLTAKATGHVILYRNEGGDPSTWDPQTMTVDRGHPHRHGYRRSRRRWR